MSKLLLFMVMSVFLVSAAYATLGGDVTDIGDVVLGVPNNGVDFEIGWPENEAPEFAIDNDAETKYLHFLGEVETTGIQITPAIAGTTVGGLSFTTANDAIERDPMTWELYGSNTSIDGEYTLIATGETYLPEDRFAANTSPIEFDPIGPFDHYQILFPTIRDAGAANSMQIAEIELLRVPEPLTLCLLGLGGMTVLRRRHQH